MSTAGRFFVTPTSIRLFRELLAAHDHLPGPRLRTDDGLRAWLIDAGMTARRDPEAERRRPDGLQAWRCAEAYGYLWLIVSGATSDERPLPQVVAVAVRGDEGPPARAGAESGSTPRSEPAGDERGVACDLPGAVVEAFLARVYAFLPPHKRPASRTRTAAREWLEAAAATARRAPGKEAARRDGRQVWRCSHAYARLYLVVDPGDAACVGVYLHEAASTGA